MPKVCSRKICRRNHDTTFKQCPPCREIDRRCRKKCKNKVKDVPPGHRRCRGSCDGVKPVTEFQSMHVRRTTLTTRCQRCRDSLHRSEMNPNTISGQCKQVWLNWKKGKVCAHCGTDRHIQADHCRGDKKVKEGSAYKWWAWHGGPEAQQRELDDKCQPLCLFCHRVKSKKERGTCKQARYIRRHKIINDEKLRVGFCETCDRTVTPDNTQWFDWAHKDRATWVIYISKLVYKSEKYFQTQWPIERAKCKLLCCLCHKDETTEENKRENLIAVSNRKYNQGETKNSRT